MSEEEMFDAYDKLVIAGISREFFGSILFSRGSKTQHEFVARAIAEVTGVKEGTRSFEELVKRLERSVTKLSEWGVLDLKEYEVKLTAWGQSIATSIPEEEYRRILGDIAKRHSR